MGDSHRNREVPKTIFGLRRSREYMTSISVVIPLYNKAPHIERALNSILSQTIQPIEIVVVDDGSTDGGPKIVENFNYPNIRLIRQEHQGVSIARNRGITESKGGLISFLDADDVWLPGYLEEINKLRERFPEAGILGTAFEIVTEEGLLKRPEFNCLPAGCNQGLLVLLKVCFQGPLWTGAVTVPKCVFEQIGVFKEGEILLQDLDMWLRISFRYPIAWSKKYLARYYKNAVNRSIGFRMFTDEPAVSRTAREALKKGLVGAELAKELKEIAAICQLTAVIHLIYQNKKEKALELLTYSRGTQKFSKLWWQCRLLIGLPGNMGSILLKTNRIIKCALGF